MNMSAAVPEERDGLRHRPYSQKLQKPPDVAVLPSFWLPLSLGPYPPAPTAPQPHILRLQAPVSS